ncbi:MAG: CHASE2 domain-containing protein [Myxococcales bacterium]|nr:CHASE2 domain-containing protein [Myxococcales bacterium]
MIELPFQSAGRRFVKKFGFAFAWAAFFGGVFGGLVYYRVPRTELDEVQPWHSRLRGALESVELVSFDWRARALGRISTRSDLAVPIAIDDDALSSAREDSAAFLGAHPWPREALGEMAEQVLREGGELVLFDLPMSDLSPRSCNGATTDDRTFRAILDRKPASSLLSFEWAPRSPRPGERELRPFLLFVGSHRSLAEAREGVRKVLAERAPAYLVPEGDRVGLWAAAVSEQRARELADAWQLKAQKVRERTAADQQYEVPPWRLLASLAEVRVEGLDPSKLPHVRSLSPPAAVLLSEASLYGASTVSADPDGVVRGFHQLVVFAPEEGKGHLLPSAALAAAMQLAGTRSLRYERGRLYVGEKLSIPMDESGYSLLRWDAPEARSSKGSLSRSISAWKLLVNLRDHKLRRGVVHHDNALEGKVAILTDSSSRGPQPLLTPIGAAPAGAVLGQALVNLLRSDGIERVSPKVDLLLAVAFAFVGAFLAMALSSLLGARSGPLWNFLALFAASGLYLFAARHLFLTQARWVAVAGPTFAMGGTFLAAMGYAAALERRLREFVTSALGRAVSPEVVRRVESDIALMRPERRAMTIYYSDLEGFTSLSDRMKPDRLSALLNEYLTEMANLVTLGKGQVDKYIGDALMAFWGAPVRLDDHAQAACESALMMREAFSRRRKEWEKLSGQALELRAGLNTGQVVVGDMGSALRANYTVMGEAVALAARLETMSKRYRTPILAGEATVKAASDRFSFREVDRVRIAGRGEVVRVFELLGRKGQLSEGKARLLAAFEPALASYHDRRFAEALERFESSAQAFHDSLSTRYARRCRYLFEHEPPSDWEGVYPGPE